MFGCEALIDKRALSISRALGPSMNSTNALALTELVCIAI
jgi:hypothetical protein